MKTTYYAQKELTIDGQTVKRGEVVGVLESSHPADRVLAGLGNGSVAAEAPKPAPAAAAAAKPAGKGDPK